MSKKSVLGIAVATLILGVVAAAAMSARGNSNGVEHVSHGGTTTGHILASEVNLSNVKAYEAQFRHDVPIGTSKQRVGAYLAEQKIPHFFTEPNSGSGENTFYGTIKNIGSRWGFPASLAIRIHLDSHEKVDKIWFHVDYDAP